MQTIVRSIIYFFDITIYGEKIKIRVYVIFFISFWDRNVT
jgi:hypothetical protein